MGNRKEMMWMYYLENGIAILGLLAALFPLLIMFVGFPIESYFGESEPSLMGLLWIISLMYILPSGLVMLILAIVIHITRKGIIRMARRRNRKN